MHLKDLEIKNPIWIASSHLTEKIENIKECCKREIGGVVLKGTNGRSSSPCDRICSKCRVPHSWKGRKFFVNDRILYSFTPNSELCESLSIEEVELLLSRLKNNHPQIVRIANIWGENPNEIHKTAKVLKNYGAQALELNVKYIIRYKDKTQEIGVEKYLSNVCKKQAKLVFQLF